MQMSNLNISPSKANKFGIKIAKDGVIRSAEEVLTQKGVNMTKIREIWPEILNNGADIDLITISGGTHSSSLFVSYSQALEWFNTLKDK